MRPLQTDLSVYGSLDFEKPPVGVKFLFFRPEGMEPLAEIRKGRDQLCGVFSHRQTDI